MIDKTEVAKRMALYRRIEELEREQFINNTEINRLRRIEQRLRNQVSKLTYDYKKLDEYHNP